MNKKIVIPVLLALILLGSIYMCHRSRGVVIHEQMLKKKNDSTYSCEVSFVSNKDVVINIDKSTTQHGYNHIYYKDLLTIYKNDTCIYKDINSHGEPATFIYSRYSYTYSFKADSQGVYTIDYKSIIDPKSYYSKAKLIIRSESDTSDYDINIK